MSDYSAHRDLNVWKEAFELAKCIYKLTKSFPKDELYGLTSQMRRAAVSIPSNITEGYRRGSKAAQLQFSLIAYGSATELETQLDLSKDLGFCSDAKALMNVEMHLNSSLRLLNRYCAYLKRSNQPHATTQQRNYATE